MTDRPSGSSMEVLTEHGKLPRPRASRGCTRCRAHGRTCTRELPKCEYCRVRSRHCTCLKYYVSDLESRGQRLSSMACDNEGGAMEAQYMNKVLHEIVAMEARFRSFINELVVLKQILRDATGSGEGAESIAADSNPQSNTPPTTGSFSAPADLSDDPADLSDDPANPFSDTAYPLSDQSEVDSSVPSTPHEQQLTVPRTPTPQSLDSMRVLISPRRRRRRKKGEEEEGEEEDEEEEDEEEEKEEEEEEWAHFNDV